MRIAQINISCGQGSTGKLAVDLNQGFIKLGHESLVFYASGKSNYIYGIKIGNKMDQMVHAFMSRLTGVQGYYSRITTKKLLRKLDEYNPDIVHLHNLHGNYINLPLFFEYARKKNLPVVVTLHDCWFFTGKCTYFIETNCNKWKDRCDKCPQLHIDNINPTFFFDRTRKCFEDKKKWFCSLKRLGVIGVSEWITNEASHSFLNAGKIITINNWINKDVFCVKNVIPTNLQSLIQKKIILFVSTNLSEKKGYREMKYLAQYLSDEYQIIFVGKNEKKLPIPNNVIYLDHVQSQELLAEIYSLADVCVNTTKYETFGMVSVEAMACGTPVVVYNNTASASIVPDGCGKIVDENKGCPGVLEAVVDICKKGMKKKPEDLSAIIHETYSQSDAIKKHLNFYESLIEMQ